MLFPVSIAVPFVMLTALIHKASGQTGWTDGYVDGLMSGCFQSFFSLYYTYLHIS